MGSDLVCECLEYFEVVMSVFGYCVLSFWLCGRLNEVIECI